jgi:hypothetical protein
MNIRSAWKLMLIAAAIVAASNIAALAGPPLICHPFQIGEAKSLPWGNDPAHWDQPLETYNLGNLADETLALLSPGTPVIVHMETIRRAVIYAHRSPEVSKELILKMSARAHEAESQSKPDALALFDYGYLIEATKQISWTYHEPTGRTEQPNVAMNLDGYPWVTEALAASGKNPEMEFAAALIVMGRPELKAHREHAQAALAGAGSDPLLARNLTTHFVGADGDTMTGLLAKAAKGSE